MAEHPPRETEELGHEPTAVSGRAIAISVAVLFASIAVAIVLMSGLSSYLANVRQGEPTVGPAGTPIAPPPGVPPVTADQTDTRQRLRALEEALLTQYAWIDRESGVARIPLERAMEILAQRPTPTPEMRDDAADDDMAVR